MEATTVRLGRGGIGPALVPAAGVALAAGTIAYGFAARAEGTRLGASLAPFLWDWRPDLGTSALPAASLLATGLWVATSLPVHAIGHPPGLLLTLHWLGIDGAPGMAALTIGAGALAIPLTYLLARELLDEDRARSATLLYVFAPSAILYGATSADALYATLALAAAAPLALAARSRAAAGALPLGAATLAVASFFSYANLAIGAWATLLAAQRAGLRRAARLAVVCGGVLAAFYALLHLATGYDPVGVLRATESVYREGVASRRPYEFWLFGSPVAFLCALGLPIAWFALRSAGARYAPAVALVAVVIVAAVLGFSKAETERIYQFLVPLACVAAAASLPARWLPLTLGALAAQALAIELLVYTVW